MIMGDGVATLASDRLPEIPKAASSNPNLNRPVSQLYTVASSFHIPNVRLGRLYFTATGVGTQTFTAATDPNLTIQILASHPDGSDGTDYVHNDAFPAIRSAITAVPNHTTVLSIGLEAPHGARRWAVPALYCLDIRRQR